jgi:hypothetical protein
MMRHGYARPQGVFFLLVGGLMFKFFAWDVMEAAKHHADTVEISTKAVVVAGVALTLGAVYLIFGDLGKRFLNKDQTTGKLRPIAWIPILAIAGSGFLVNYLVRCELIRLGYDVGYF